MSTRPFIAARIEMSVDRRVEQVMRMLGWRERVIPYTAYGGEGFARVLGRVVLSPRFSETQLGKAAEEFLRRRGWRNFFSVACVHARYTIAFGDAVVRGTTDRGGYVDHRVRNHGVGPGRATATVSTELSPGVGVPVHIVDPAADVGIVSDIDDTILSTMLPRPLIAAWNSFVRTEAARQAIPGMAVLYDEFRASHPGAPIVYLSTSAWNLHGFLDRFMRRHRYPEGPMLLTDWGATNTGWFRSGVEHKKRALLQLSLDFPKIRWLLVGDDGQHDPVIYSEFSAQNPGKVLAIAIRQLSPAEHYLAHGTTEPLEDGASAPGVPILRAPDGRGLLQKARDRYQLL